MSHSFDYIRINVASPDKIKSWAEKPLPNGAVVGEVTSPETIHYNTLKPVMGGLFCERIFGPVNDWECHCGKYKNQYDHGIRCERCGVQVASSSSRRQNLGFIQLVSPVTHIWYLKSRPSKIALLLDMTSTDIHKIVYFQAYVILNHVTNPDFPYLLSYKSVIREGSWDYFFNEMDIDLDQFELGLGAPAIKKLLTQLDLEEEARSLRSLLPQAAVTTRVKLIKRLRLIEQFIGTGAKPSWMVLDTLPVLPPELRPMLLLENGSFAVSEINDLYRSVIIKNNRLYALSQSSAPVISIHSEQRMLQEAVDALLQNGRCGSAVVGSSGLPLKSLTDVIEGKEGRFRLNLLGKRVDYSGRSVIIVGPELHITQCGLPIEMALELFKPFVIHKLLAARVAFTIRQAKILIQDKDPLVVKTLEQVVAGHPVILNRAPTLHRLGVQAFDPVLVEGRAIKLHPLVCPAFNADFDGDQMAVHVPLGVEAQLEARLLLHAPNNFASPNTGAPIGAPTQDMVLGSYYLTCAMPQGKSPIQYFYNFGDVITAYRQSLLGLQTLVWVRCNNDEQDHLNLLDNYRFIERKVNNQIICEGPDFLIKKNPNETILQTYLKTTPGRILLNECWGNENH